MAGHWGCSEPAVARKVNDAASKVQSHPYKKINFDCIQKNKTYIIRVYGMHCETEEFYVDPSTKWSTQKKNTSGLMHESVCAINREQWL